MTSPGIAATRSRRKADPETLWYSKLQSPIGVLAIVVSETGLRAIEFRGEAFPENRYLSNPAYQGCNITWVEDGARTQPCVNELEAYFAGKLRDFRMPLDLRGTGFQKECWLALLRIPYGTTKSYADIAREVGRPVAFRAVGMANHSNPIPIVVPCHRVLAANGSLCGYGGGLDVKEKLLRLEGALPVANLRLEI